jgi:hypothetical protein
LLDYHKRGYELGLSDWTEQVDRAEGELLCILGGGIEKEEAADLVWRGRGCVGVVL